MEYYSRLSVIWIVFFCVTTSPGARCVALAAPSQRVHGVTHEPATEALSSCAALPWAASPAGGLRDKKPGDHRVAHAAISETPAAGGSRYSPHSGARCSAVARTSAPNHDPRPTWPSAFHNRGAVGPTPPACARAAPQPVRPATAPTRSPCGIRCLHHGRSRRVG